MELSKLDQVEPEVKSPVETLPEVKEEVETGFLPEGNMKKISTQTSILSLPSDQSGGRMF